MARHAGAFQGRSAHPEGAPIAAAAVGRDFPKLLERVPAIIYIADTGAAGAWHYVSPQIQSILGFSPEEWCEDPELWAERLHPDDRDRVLADEAGEREPGPSEYRMIHRDGRVVWIRDDALLVREQDGRMRWHGVLSDITEGKLAEAELEHRAAQQAAVATLGEHALEGASTAELMHEATMRAAEILDVDVSSVLEPAAEDGFLVQRAGYGWPPEADTGNLIPSGAGSQSGFTIVSDSPVVVCDWSAERRFHQSDTLRNLGIRSGLTVVIEGTRGPFGVLGVHSRRPRTYSRGDVDFLQSLANVLGDALERQSIEDDIRHRALHDPLTGLPNRALFLDRVEHALARLGRRTSLAAIMFLDLDHFKLINDSLGHHVGDELLAAAAPRLSQAVRVSDTVARFGGDEFGVLLEDIRSPRDAIETAERIASSFARPFVLGDGRHVVSTSIGIALARGGERPQELIRDADAAMYRAKERGRARYELFDEAMRGRAIARLQVENDLRGALDRGELRLDYQPIVSLRHRSVVGAEALLRWEHPQRGVVLPSEFVGIAEENGLIEPIGRWALERACRQAVRWQREQPEAPPIGVSVNLSVVQFARRDLPQIVDSALRASDLDPALLSLEITESVMLRDVEAFTDALGALKEIGVKLVLDDFGTGYSSLGYLTRLPLDVLKIDRSFVEGLGVDRRDTAIAEAIVAMSRALSLEVVAEGVETEAQLAELDRLGCDLAQGFYFSRPVSPRKIAELLRPATGRRSARAALG
jgi:diguanylate cyclase (GGDEF)-like protein/PAS domain S-box-containing protein